MIVSGIHDIMECKISFMERKLNPMNLKDYTCGMKTILIRRNYLPVISAL